ncbi:Gastric triacylglycerol lipase [Spatholobus suberectus]|nr:Gastric triacylglycerol lipase [Spatholobus suberectus]
MENGVSSFNQFIHELSVDSDNSSPEYSSGEEDSDRYSDSFKYPPSPASQSSRTSEAGFTKYSRHQMDWIQYILLSVLLPVKLLLWIPLHLFQLVYYGASKAMSISRNKRPSHLHAHKRVLCLKDHIIHRTTDRRRGLVEDLHLGIELSIEAVFDVVHKAAHLLLSPTEAFGRLFRLFSSNESGTKEDRDGVEGGSIYTSTQGENDPTPTERNIKYQPLNTDARTCQDVITDLGYPYEAIHVITADGYILLLERIPRRDSRKAVYLQHGVLDSSMGWVSNGVVGSPAFAAYDQGYDVFLGNFRGLVSREHVNKNISSRQYWRYSINEHGTEDIPAMIDKIHQVKTAELRLTKPDIEEETDDDQLYKLCAICHSLGGAAMMMYVITRRIEGKPHRLSRLVLLSPAGFHGDSNIVFSMAELLLVLLAPVLSLLVPAFYIPTRFFRMLVNKLARDLHNLPAVGGLVQTLMSYVVGGDSSNWVGVLGLPHYNMNDMPGVSFRVALHLAQMKRTGRFRMFDYGSASANMEVYGSPMPLDLGEYYGRIDIPVDLVAGQKDKVIRPSMVKRHYKLMKGAGVDVSYNEFEYAHLDFTFSHREELLSYVMSCLLLVDPNPKHHVNQRVVRSRRKG